MKLLIAPIEIAGYYSNLSRDLRKLGIHVDLAFYYENSFNYSEKGDDFWLVRMIRGLKAKSNQSNSIAHRALLQISAEILSIFFCFSTLSKYDTYLFSFGSSLATVTHLDLLILRLFRKRIISNIAHGSECRPPYMNGRFQNSDTKQLRLETRRLIWNLRWLEKFSHELIGAPYSSSLFARRSFINVYDLGLPRGEDRNKVGRRDSTAEPLRILHAPSSRITKGTSKIKNVFDDLERQNLPVEFTIVEGLANNELLAMLGDYDLVVDQLYSDTPWPGLASECAIFGVPVIVGGYGLEELKPFLRPNIEYPSITIKPDSLKEVLISITSNTSILDSARAKVQMYKEKELSGVAIAFNFLSVLEGKEDEFMRLDPNEVRYFEGLGQDKITTATQILRVRSEGGAVALGLKDKPELYDEMVKWAEETVKLAS